MTSLKSIRKHRQQLHAREVRGLVAFCFCPLREKSCFPSIFNVQTMFTPISRLDKHAELVNIYFKPLVKVADLNFGCATFCALPSFDAVTTFTSHTTFSSHKVNVKGSDIDMCSAIYFLFDHNTKYCTIYLCPHTVLATVWLSPWR